ncbi:MAG: FGGY family carbohydrate kinase [Cyclobacteriaceae bacterium]
MYYIGFDIGSSSIKASIVDADSKQSVGLASYPDTEMSMISKKTGWAEQEPEDWWKYVCEASRRVIKKAGIDKKGIVGIGLSYQMHGLVLVDKQQRVLRPSIIWCDGRAVAYGNESFSRIGEARSLSQLLNSPGNFTAAKLKWVKENEPDIYNKVYKMMLPGDFIAMKMTGEISTTISGLSEGIFWDFSKNELAGFLMEDLGIDKSLIPKVHGTFFDSGHLSAESANLLGLNAGIPVAYRAGDQPNNALSLGVFEPGDIAATGGTSGVVYSVSDQLIYDQKSRINGFAHVNHSQDHTRIGSLLCINGTGIQYRWLKQQLAPELDYDQIEKIAQKVPVGSDGVHVLPFGNGAERIFENKEVGSHILNVDFNRHDKSHLFRAGLEGIAFSFVYGVEILKELGSEVNKIRVGNDNLFQSRVFSETIATLLNCEIEMVETTGATGAAQAVGFALGHRKSIQEAIGSSQAVDVYMPLPDRSVYQEHYASWRADLDKFC